MKLRAKILKYGLKPNQQYCTITTTLNKAINLFPSVKLDDVLDVKIYNHPIVGDCYSNNFNIDGEYVEFDNIQLNFKYENDFSNFLKLYSIAGEDYKHQLGKLGVTLIIYLEQPKIEQPSEEVFDDSF